jgi:hypothetical protein
VFRSAWPTRSPQNDGIEREPDHPLVVDVGASQSNSDRDAARIDQNVSF